MPEPADHKPVRLEQFEIVAGNGTVVAEVRVLEEREKAGGHYRTRGVLVRTKGRYTMRDAEVAER